MVVHLQEIPNAYQCYHTTYLFYCMVIKLEKYFRVYIHTTINVLCLGEQGHVTKIISTIYSEQLLNMY